MIISLAKLTFASWMAYSATHSGMVFQRYEAASLGANVYECDIELTPQASGGYGAPYTLIDCEK